MVVDKCKEKEREKERIYIRCVFCGMRRKGVNFVTEIFGTFLGNSLNPELSVDIKTILGVTFYPL